MAIRYDTVNRFVDFTDGNGTFASRADNGITALVDPADLAAQIAGKQALGADIAGTYVAMPNSAIEAALAIFSPLGAGVCGVHSVAAVNGASLRWKTFTASNVAVGIPGGVGLVGTIAVDPPAIAAQTLWTAAVALPAELAFVGANDLLITGGINPGVDLIACPFYMSGANIRTSLHAVAAQDGAALTYNVIVIRTPRTTSVSVDPPDLAAQIMAKIAVTVPGFVLGDLVGVIPPNDLEADLIFTGAYVSAVDTVTICVHSVAAINGAAKAWRFVRLPGGLAI